MERENIPKEILSIEREDVPYVLYDHEKVCRKDLMV
jgi:hypothetical protein